MIPPAPRSRPPRKPRRTQPHIRTDPDLTFIETQLPVSKLSKESFKERKSNYSQTLTGLGKWWGRKPLILCAPPCSGCVCRRAATRGRTERSF
jgi:hypothetical protein